MSRSSGATDLLVAAGRTPNSRGVGANLAGVELDSSGMSRCTVFGTEASELTTVAQTAMIGHLPYTALRDAVFTHPTAAEGLTILLADVKSAVGKRGR